MKYIIKIEKFKLSKKLNKKYENYSGDFSFAINVENCTKKQMNDIFEEIDKNLNFNNFNKYTSFNKNKFLDKFFNSQHFTKILILEIFTYPSTKSKKIKISEAYE